MKSNFCVKGSSELARIIKNNSFNVRNLDSVNEFETFHLEDLDVLFIDVTRPDVTTGYFIAKCIDAGKQVVVLYNADKTQKPSFAGLPLSNIKLVPYTSANIKEVVASLAKDLESKNEYRFTFTITPLIERYINWVLKEKNLPRATYLRSLIERDLLKNRDYKRSLKAVKSERST